MTKNPFDNTWKTKELISCAVTFAFAFVFANAKSSYSQCGKFSYDVAVIQRIMGINNVMVTRVLLLLAGTSIVLNVDVHENNNLTHKRRSESVA